MSTRFELIKRYLQEDPSDSFLRYALALEYIAINNNDLAYADLVNLLNDDPDYLAGYYQAGKVAESLGKNSEAMIWYSKGIQVARAQGETHTLYELQSALDVMEE